MGSDDVAGEARRFIGEHISSVAQLEMLLMLHTNPGERWSAETLARELRVEAAWAEERLVEFSARGLAARTADEPAAYSFRAATPELERQVTALARAYLLHRVSIIEAIYSKPSESIRVFADAFKLKKEPPHG